MGKISPGPSRWPPGAERRLVPDISNLKPQTSNHKWPTTEPRGYITPAAWGFPAASQPVPESEVANKWAWWLHNPCRLGGGLRFRAQGKITGGPQMGPPATIPPAAWGVLTASEPGVESGSGPQAGKVAT